MVLPMPSSKGSPGPHDRRPGVERQQCVALNKIGGKRCRRWATSGKSKLCRSHLAKAQSDPEYKIESAKSFEAATANREPEPEPERIGVGPRGQALPDPSPGDSRKASLAANLSKRQKFATTLVINAQARAMLTKLGQPYDPSATHEDPKKVLLHLVASTHLQVQIWQAMLSSIPDSDYNMLGVPSLPGDPNSSKGARIEVLHKFLNDALKVAVRTSKLAIDAGIEERLVRIAEEQQNLIADTVRAGLIAGLSALARSGVISPDAEKAALDAATGAAATHLRQLAAGTSPEVIEGVAKAVRVKRWDQARTGDTDGSE